MANLRTNNLCGQGGRDAYNGSVFFDGNSHLEIASSSDFAYGTGDFNWEAWVLLARGQATGYIFDHGNDGGTLQYESNKVRYYNSTTGNSGALYDDGGSIDYDGWHHIAVSRSSGTTKLFVNGIQKASASDGHNYSAQVLTIGDYGANTGTNKWRGYISNARICKGHAIYTGNFTPPTSPLTVHYTSDGDETVLLCCQDSDDPTKDTAGRHTITAFGGSFQTGNQSILINSDFSQGTTGFTGDSGASISESGGVMTVTNGGGDNLYALKQNSCLRIGGKYRCTATVTPTFASGNPVFRVRFGGDAVSFTQQESTMSTGVAVRIDTGEKVADGTDFEIGSGTSSGITQFTITDLVVTAIDPPIAPKVIPPYGVDAGNTFDGAISMNSSSWMYFPTGRTEERGRGRALLGGGHDASGATNHIQQLSIQSQGNTENFGDLTYVRWIPAPSSSSTRGVWSGGGGYNPGSPTGSYVNFIDFVTIATPANATDFGDQTAERGYHAGLSNETRGIIAGGYNDSVGKIDVIEFITIATLGNAQDFGDLTAARMQLAAAGSPTRGLFFGGSINPNVNGDVVDYITIATTGNAQDFGDMTSTTKYGNATSSNTRAIYGGGLAPNDTTYVNTIEYFTIATTGDATDFGDLTATRSTTPGATSNNIRGIFAGGYVPGNVNSIDFVTIASVGHAADFGDITSGALRGIGALSDSHGGLS